MDYGNSLSLGYNYGQDRQREASRQRSRPLNRFESMPEQMPYRSENLSPDKRLESRRGS